MLNITQRMQMLQKELPIFICILQEGIHLIDEITQSVDSSPEQKLNHIRYLFLFYNRLKTFGKNFLVLKSEAIMLEQKVGIMLEYGEETYSQVKKIMQNMLEELENLPI